MIKCIVKLTPRHNRTFDYTTMMDSLRKVRLSDNSHQTVVVNLGFKAQPWVQIIGINSKFASMNNYSKLNEGRGVKYDAHFSPRTWYQTWAASWVCGLACRPSLSGSSSSSLSPSSKRQQHARWRGGSRRQPWKLWTWMYRVCWSSSSNVKTFSRHKAG